jgi:hypothetical protein
MGEGRGREEGGEVRAKVLYKNNPKGDQKASKPCKKHGEFARKPPNEVHFTLHT